MEWYKQAHRCAKHYENQYEKAQKMSVAVPRLKAALEMQERPTNPSTWVADRWSIVVGYATSAISSPKRSRRLGGSEARAFTKLQQSTDNLEV